MSLSFFMFKFNITKIEKATELGDLKIKKPVNL